MRWHPLGHASFLVEVGELRLLFDPLLSANHHGGVFAVTPQRTVHAEALRPDFIFVSHRHTDHFDVRSLARLARLDADSVVVTPDPLVADVARKVGFRSVRTLLARTHVELDGCRLVTTDSIANDAPFDEALEWGVALCDAHGTIAWNQVDTGHRDVGHVRDTIAEVHRAFGRNVGDIALALVRWCPLLEVEALTAGPIGFPYRAYFEQLEQVAAIGARAIAPTAAGARHVSPWNHLNALVYPVSEARFLRDLRARLPDVTAFSPVVGECFDVSPDGVAHVPRPPEPLVTPEPSARDDRVFHPLAIDRIVDHASSRENAENRALIDRWVGETLAPAIARSRSFAGLRLSLHVVYADGVEEHALVASDDAVTTARREEPEWDVLNVVSASALAGVIAGRRAWGDVLLAGELRCAVRAYAVDPVGGRRKQVPPSFLYAAISYPDSLVRSVAFELASLGI